MANRACSGLDGVIAAPVGKRNDVVLSHHKVVEHSHVYHLEQILRRVVTALSASEGSTMPEGWLWASMTAAAFLLRAALTTSRGEWCPH